MHRRVAAGLSAGKVLQAWGRTASVRRVTRLPCSLRATSMCPRGAQVLSVRFQSALADKKFHCSVCKKSFRLEMAASLHVQQAHGGEGSVERGAGPGNEDASSALPTYTNSPPQAPTMMPSPVVEDEWRSPRRSRPTPKPLHEPDVTVPPAAMGEMLDVWDTVGVKRLEGRFVHSSMIMKVFAAKPGQGTEPLYDLAEPEGHNPFEQESTYEVLRIDHENVYNVNLDDAYVLASEAYSPFRAAICQNPFGKATTWEAAKPRVKQAPAPEEKLTAPVTPYGQLGKFGEEQQPVAPPASAVSAAAAATPPPSSFAGGTVSSPFAATVSSPFAGQVSSSPFGVAPSPFFAAASLDGDAAAGADTLAAPVAAAPSPFTPEPGVDSPFGSQCASPFGNTATPFMPTDGTDFASFTFDSTASTTAAVPEPQHECTSCGRSFSTHDGLRMHAKAKHGLDIPKQDTKSKHPHTPELPAYIPSPVDLGLTSPFGSKAQEESWAGTEITPYALSVSNITLTGKIIDIGTTGSRGFVDIAMHVGVEKDNASEIVTVRCTDDISHLKLQREHTVFVCGTLRLLPVYEKSVNQYFSNPVVLVSSPMGMVCRVN